MRIDLLRGPLLAALLWSACAIASVKLREAGGAVLLVWIPSAVAVASLYCTPVRRWPWVLGALAVGELATLVALGIPHWAVAGLALAHLIEALICASIGIWVLGGRARGPETYRHVVGLFAAAMLGCAVGALAAYPFRSEAGLTQLAWWFLAAVLGVLTATPVLLVVRRWVPFGDETVRTSLAPTKPGFGVAVAAMFALGAVVFAGPSAAFIPLLFMAIVFAVIRYGQLAGACGVIAYLTAAMLGSTGGGSPAPFLALTPFEAGLALQALMLLMLATALPIAAMLLKRDQLEARLREQNAGMHEHLTILNLAESLARIGRWRCDMLSGDQQWSPLMLELNGLPRDIAPDPESTRALLRDGGEHLFGELDAHRKDRQPYSIEYRVAPPDGTSERILKMHVSNEFDEAGERSALFAVAMDVTDQVQREQALDQARKQAVGLAAQAQKLANTDALTGLANRRATLDWLSSLVGVADEEDMMTVLMIDIDHFKRINDRFGHQTGDEVLKRVAEIARSEVRAEDLVGRIGGEEFVCILSNLTTADARKLAERLCHVTAIETAREGLPRTTISIGLAPMRLGDTPESLMARADAALYEAKEAGRNQVRRAA